MKCNNCEFENRKGVKFCEECGLELPKPAANICTKCGFENRQVVKFCEECGNRLLTSETNICPECGFENRAGVKFCEECGTSLIDIPTPQTEKLQPPPLSPVKEQPPVIVTIQDSNKKHTWAWVMVGGLFIVFAFLFVSGLWPSLSNKRISLNNNNNQPSSAPIVEDSEPVVDSSNEVSPAQEEYFSQDESIQEISEQSSQVEEPIPVEEVICNRSKYVRETIPDNTVFQPGENFQKTWTVRNEGECTWNTEYTFEHTQGAYLDAATKINMPKVVEPGDEVTLSLDMRAPDEPGTYIGRWEIFSDDGEVLGWYSVVIDVMDDSVLEPFSVTSVNLFLDSKTEPCCTRACADISSSGTGTVTYIWEEIFAGGAKESGSIYFDTAGTKTVCSTFYSPGSADVSFYVDNPNHQNFGTIRIP